MSELLIDFAVNVKGPDGNISPWSLETLREEVARKKEEYLVGRFGREIPQKSDELWTLAKERLDSAPIQPSSIGLSGDREQVYERHMTIDGVNYEMILMRHYGGRYVDVPGQRGQKFVPSSDDSYDSEIRLYWTLPSVTEEEKDKWYQKHYPDLDEDGIFPEDWELPWGERNRAVWLEIVTDGKQIYNSPSVNIVPENEQPRLDAKLREEIGSEDIHPLKQIEMLERSARPATTSVNLLTWGTEAAPLPVFPSTGDIAFIGHSRQLRERDLPHVEIMLEMLRSDQK